MEWPPRSGKLGEYPEVDRAEYFSLEIAKEKLNEAQGLLLPRLLQALSEPKPEEPGGRAPGK
jgi:predicted NUDIX family NTP pyrophosphohydrolase